jgi:hypothetical protein
VEADVIGGGDGEVVSKRKLEVADENAGERGWKARKAIEPPSQQAEICHLWEFLGTGERVGLCACVVRFLYYINWTVKVSEALSLLPARHETGCMYQSTSLPF